MKYEIWKKSSIGTRHGLPDRSHYTLDSSILSAQELSKGFTTQRIWNEKKKVPGQKWDGGYDDVDIPNMFAVIERGDKQSRVRGWGINGKFVDARDCKRCNNTGTDPNVYQQTCNSCRGASYQPKV